MDKSLEDAISVANHYGVTDGELAAAVEAATAARRAEVDRPGLVPMVRIADRAPLLVDPDAVPVYEQSGWTVKPADPQPNETDAPATKAKTKKDE